MERGAGDCFSARSNNAGQGASTRGGRAARRPGLPLALLGTLVLGAASAHGGETATATTEDGGSLSASYSTENRYFSYDGDPGDPKFFGAPGGGRQVLSIHALSAAYETPLWKLELLGRGAYLHSRQTTVQLDSSVSTPTDTTVSMTATYLGLDGWQPFVSLNANLPTGRAAIFGYAVPPRLDPDFVDAPVPGEGFNLGPTFGATIALAETLVASVSAGYTWRNPYDKEGPYVPGSPQGTIRVTPGHLATIAAGLSWAEGAWSAEATATAMTATTIAQSGVPLMRPGPQLSFAGGLGYAWSERHRTKVSASWSWSAANDVPNAFGTALEREALNSNSNVWRLGIEHTVKLDDRWSLGPLASVLYRDHNAYSLFAQEFVPAKLRWSTGLQGGVALDDKTSLTARFERIWVSERDQSFSAGIPSNARHGWLVSLGGSYTF